MIESEALAVGEEIAAAGATAPRITLQAMRDEIAGMNWFNLGDAACRLGQPDSEGMHRITLCALTLKNGYVLVGESASASLENYDAEKGRQFAYEDAMSKLGGLMAFRLRDQLTATAS